MNEIIAFNYEETNIRTFTDEKKNIWFVAKDIFNALGITSKGGQSDALKSLDSDELGSFKTNSGGQTRELKTISESGIYSLIMRSRKEIAKPFQKWVTRDVLPQIRKTGSYQLTETVPESKELSITKELEILKFKIESYGYSQKEKIEVSNILFRKLGTDELPLPKEVEKHSFKNSLSLTVLLEKHNIQMRTADFNIKLAKIGIIERKGKNWFILNLDFGVNEDYENKTNPKYFEETFDKLLSLVFPPK